MKQIKTAYVHPPIPVRQFDWAAWFDGEEENINGFGETELDAVKDLHRQAQSGQNQPLTDSIFSITAHGPSWARRIGYDSGSFVWCLFKTIYLGWTSSDFASNVNRLFGFERRSNQIAVRIWRAHLCVAWGNS